MNKPPLRAILINHNVVVCDSDEDRQMLQDAKSIADDPSAASNLTIGRLHLIKDACQRYSLGSLQRLVKMAIDRGGRE